MALWIDVSVKCVSDSHDMLMAPMSGPYGRNCFPSAPPSIMREIFEVKHNGKKGDSVHMVVLSPKCMLQLKTAAGIVTEHYITDMTGLKESDNPANFEMRVGDKFRVSRVRMESKSDWLPVLPDDKQFALLLKGLCPPPPPPEPPKPSFKNSLPGQVALMRRKAKALQSFERRTSKKAVGAPVEKRVGDESLYYTEAEERFHVKKAKGVVKAKSHYVQRMEKVLVRFDQFNGNQFIKNTDTKKNMVDVSKLQMDAVSLQDESLNVGEFLKTFPEAPEQEMQWNDKNVHVVSNFNESILDSLKEYNDLKKIRILWQHSLVKGTANKVELEEEMCKSGEHLKELMVYIKTKISDSFAKFKLQSGFLCAIRMDPTKATKYKSTKFETGMVVSFNNDTRLTTIRVEGSAARTMEVYLPDPRIRFHEMYLDASGDEEFAEIEEFNNRNLRWSQILREREEANDPEKVKARALQKKLAKAYGEDSDDLADEDEEELDDSDEDLFSELP